MSARVPLVAIDAGVPELDAIERACQARGYSAPDIYRLLAHAPRLLKGFVDLAYPLVGIGEGEKPPRIGRPLQELVIMRVNQMTGSDYEWEHHYPAAIASGVTERQLEVLSCWSVSEAFDSRERLALAFVDVIAASGSVSPELFALLQASFDPTELVELALTAAFYCCVAQFVNTFALEVEPDRRTFVRSEEVVR